MDTQSLATLSDADLLVRVKRLAQNERSATTALIAHLAEIETRKLYLGEACSSLFTYCVRVLHLSEPAAYNRIQAARAVRRFPAVLTNLEQGRVHLAAVRLLAPLLTAENHLELLAAAAHRSKRDVEELVARLRPQPDVPDQVRKLPAAPKAQPASDIGESTETPQPARATNAASNGGALGFEPESKTAIQPKPEGAGAAQSAVAPSSPRERAAVVPLAPERYKVQFTADAATREKLRRAQELLRHRIPDGDVAQVFDLALDLLVRDLEKRKFAHTGRLQQSERRADEVHPANTLPPGIQTGAPPVGTRPSPARPCRYIPAAVRRAVWARDQGQCAFVNAGGERCTERGALEFDHIRPHADGGGVELQNVRLLCRQHNQYEAQQFLGPWQSEPLHQREARCC